MKWLMTVNFCYVTGNLASGTLKPGSSLGSPSSTSTGVTFASVQSLRSQASSMGGSRVGVFNSFCAYYLNVIMVGQSFSFDETSHVGKVIYCVRYRKVLYKTKEH